MWSSPDPDLEANVRLTLTLAPSSNGNLVKDRLPGKKITFFGGWFLNDKLTVFHETNFARKRIDSSSGSSFVLLKNLDPKISYDDLKFVYDTVRYVRKKMQFSNKDYFTKKNDPEVYLSSPER